jgi:hypothetical protein
VFFLSFSLFLVLLIGPTYPLRSVWTPNQLWYFWTNFSNTGRRLDINSSLLTEKPNLKNTGSLKPYSLTASHNKTFAGNLFLRVNLTLTSYVALLLPLIAFNREIGLVIHHTFENRFWWWTIVDVLCFRCGVFGFAVNSHLCQIFFDSFMMKLDLPPQFTIRVYAVTCCLFLQGCTSFERWKGTFSIGSNFSLHSYLLILKPFNCTINSRFLISQ